MKHYEDMKDEIELLWTGLKVRVKDTFTSTFFVSWVLWNWKAVLYIVYPMNLDKWDLTARIDFIEGDIYDTVGKAWRMLAWGPLISALFFLLVLPLATNLVDKVYQKYLVTRRKNQIKAQSDLMFTTDEVNAITEENRTMRLELDQLRSQNSVQGMDLYRIRQDDQQLKHENGILRKHIGPEDMNKAVGEGVRRTV